MGLQSHFSDFSSESILVFMAVVVGRSVCYIRSFLLAILRGFGFGFFQQANEDSGYLELEAASRYDVVGSGLSGLITLCDQLNLNRILSSTTAEMESETDCVVCLNPMGESDHVRRLTCRHVFHKDCFDGWLRELNFSCPVCRAPLCSDEKAEGVAGDLLAWFPFSYS